MNDALPLIFSFLGGAALGAMYFAVLWFTVRDLAQQAHPHRRLLLSLVMRMLLLLGGLYLIMGEGHWERAVSALAGFVAVRLVVVGRIEQGIGMAKAEGGESHDH